MNSRYINPHAVYEQPQQQFQQQPMMMPQPQQPMRQGGVQIALNANGQQVYVDVTTGQIVGFVQSPQQPVMARPVGMQPGVMMVGQQPMQQGRFSAAQNAHAGLMQPVQQFQQTFSNEELPTNSRYGNIQQLTQQPQQERIPVTPQYSPQAQQQPQLQPPQLMRPVVAPIVQEAVVVPNRAQALPAPVPVQVATKCDARKGISDSKVKLEVRAIPFSDKEVSPQTTATELSESFEQLVADVTKVALKDSGVTSVYIRDTITSDHYYGVVLGEKEHLLFQPDLEAVYRVLKDICPDVTNKKELCFYNAFNDWVTEAINDYLLVATKGEILIDSFYEDFNDLFKHISTNSRPVVEGLMGSIGDMLEQAMTDVEAIRSNYEDPVTDVPVAIIPRRKVLVYLKMTTDEIGLNGTGAGEKSAGKLLQSLKSHVETEIFYLATLDKGLYKAYYMEAGNVVFDRLA